MTETSNIVKSFLNNLDLNSIPFEYITGANITDNTGKEVMVKGSELQMLMNNHPNYSYVQNARIFIDMQAIVQAITIETEFVYEMVSVLLKD